MLVLLALTLTGVYFYQEYRQQQEYFVNAHYFRILHEASALLNAKLEQLHSLIEYRESEDTIRLLFPSYFNEPKTASTDSVFELDGNKIRINRDDSPTAYSIKISEILPSPKNEFVLYLLTNGSDEVLTQSGDASALSIVDTKDIGRQIREEKMQSWLNLAADGSPRSDAGNGSLPGYSYRIDMDLTSGPSRLYIYPFEIHHLSPNNIDDKTEDNQSTFYLIGVAPDNLLRMKESQRWNLSLLLLSLVLLAFVWSMVRLFMLSRNQPLGETFYRCTIMISYALFLLMAALLFSLR